MHVVVETEAFLAAAEDAGMTEEERTELVTLVSLNPMHGIVPSGWGGARKFRFAKAGKGKSGSYRVVPSVAGQERPRS